MLEVLKGTARRIRAGKENSLLAVGVIVGLVILVAVPSMFTRDLWDPDEPRYMEVSREMVALSDYTVPHLNGEVYSEKPPLWFWATAGLWRLGAGFNAGRIVTLLAVLGTLLLLWALARKEAGRQAAMLAVVTALTTVFLVDMAKEGVLDPLLMFFTTAAIVSGYYAFRSSNRRPAWFWSLSYACMALATLTKGPVGILVPGLVLLAYGLVNRERIQGGGRAHLVAAALCAGIVLAWLLPAVIAGGEPYARTILVKQNAGRVVGSWSHRNPFYYYLIQVPWRLFPWSLLLPLALVCAARLWRRKAHDLSLLAVLWLIVPVIFFSLMSGKRGRYILPVVPAAGLLCGRYLSVALEKGLRFPRAERWLLRSGLMATALAATALLVAIPLVASAPAVREMVAERAGGSLEGLPVRLSAGRAAFGMVVVAVPVIVAAGGLIVCRKSSLRLAGALAAAVLALSLALDFTIIPFFNPLKSGKHFAREVRLWAGDSARVYMFQNKYSGMYNLYSGYVSMPVLGTEQELREALSEPDAFVIGDGVRLEDALSASERERYTLYRERVGHRKMLLLSGKPSGGRLGGAISDSSRPHGPRTSEGALMQ